MFPRKHHRAFTLAELLIAMAILGVIATFTIPKILQSQQDGRNKAISKEAIASLAAAYQAYQLRNTPTANTNPGDVLQYINYVKLMTNGELIDNPYGIAGSPGGGFGCNPGDPCYVLHNGGTFNGWGVAGTGSTNGDTFGGTASTNGIYFYFDPDGVANSPGTTNGPGKSLQIFLYFNGKITTAGNCTTTMVTTETSIGTNNFCPWPYPDAPWFSWN